MAAAKEDAAGAAIGHAQATLMIAPVSRDARSSIDRIETDLGRAESRLAEVRRLIVAEQYKEATTMAEEILDLLREIWNRGTTILLATHRASLADQLKRRTLVLDGGRLVPEEG